MIYRWGPNDLFFIGDAYKADIQRRYPKATFWDGGTIVVFDTETEAVEFKLSM